MSLDPYYGCLPSSQENFLNLYYQEDLASKENAALANATENTLSFPNPDSFSTITSCILDYGPYTPPYDFEALCAPPQIDSAQEQSQLSAPIENSEDVQYSESVSSSIPSTTNQVSIAPIESAQKFWTPWLQDSSNTSTNPMTPTLQKTTNIIKEMSLATTLLETDQASSKNINSEVHVLPFSWIISSLNRKESESILGSIKSTASFENPKKDKQSPFPVVCTGFTYSIVLPKGNIDLSEIVELKKLQIMSAIASDVLQQLPILATHKNANEIEILFHPESVSRHSRERRRRILIISPAVKCVSQMFLFMTQSDRESLSPSTTNNVSKETSQVTTLKRKAPFPEFVSYPLKWTFAKGAIVNESVEGTIESEDGWDMQKEGSNLLMFFTKTGRYRISLPNKHLKEDRIIRSAIISSEGNDQPIYVRKEELQILENATLYSFSSRDFTVNCSQDSSHLRKIVLKTNLKGIFISESLMLYSNNNISAKKRNLQTEQIRDGTSSNNVVVVNPISLSD